MTCLKTAASPKTKFPSMAISALGRI